MRKFWDDIKRWFSYYKVLRKIDDFDYSSILAVEKYQITRVLKTFINEPYYHKNDIKYMTLALKLLAIVEEDGCSKLIGKEPTFKETKKGLYELIEDPHSYYAIPVYVNTKNFKRFQPKLNSKVFDNFKNGNAYRDDLRIEKAWYLYHLIKINYLRHWWI